MGKWKMGAWPKLLQQEEPKVVKGFWHEGQAGGEAG